MCKLMGEAQQAADYSDVGHEKKIELDINI